MTNKCDSCLFDDKICEDCEYPEFTDHLYRDNCQICSDLIMIPYDTHDVFNLAICKECAKLLAGEVFDEFKDDCCRSVPIGEFEGVYVEGTDPWWRSTNV